MADSLVEQLTEAVASGSDERFETRGGNYVWAEQGWDEDTAVLFVEDANGVPFGTTGMIPTDEISPAINYLHNYGF